MRIPRRVQLPMIPQRPTQDIDRDRAACRDADPKLFYSDNAFDKLAAKDICRSCDIRNECLEFALGLDEKWGIWGGLAADERGDLQRRRHRGAVA